MTKDYVLVNNGGCYSDYGVEGIVICDKKDKPNVQSVIADAYEEYNRLYSEARAQRNTNIDCITKYPVQSTVISEYCSKNNMTYITNLDEVSFDYVW
jgi:hypothetical protein